jgi:hypothetical protein
LWAEGLSAKDINKAMFPVYGGSISRKSVHNLLADVSVMMKAL